MTSGLDDFIARHCLPVTYARQAEKWFAPVAKHIATRQKKTGGTIIIGISGAQGSGKSTLADLLAFFCADRHKLPGVVLSMDDFYFTRPQRQHLATTVHPLLVTRGVPGTHDVQLAIDTILQLRDGTTETLIPRFDKAKDDRYPQRQWTHVSESIGLILLEGWCLGARPQTSGALVKPVNELEKNHDPDAQWRHHVNQQLCRVYPALFGLVDTCIMLKAPSFEAVYQWRLEQERKLNSPLAHSSLRRDRPTDRIMDARSIRNFIQHFQRITEHLLESLPARADILFELNDHREIIAARLPASQHANP